MLERRADGRSPRRGIAGVEDDELDVVRPFDDLGRERRTAHALEDDVVDALVLQFRPQCRDLLHEQARRRDRLDPAAAP
ncbi:hypothetical protein DEI81_03435 [Curtobacterium sp. MCBD17_013]|nr:hypothetical protein DEI81_03435 [Curtobacterium sp. MCBD17_013]